MSNDNPDEVYEKAVLPLEVESQPWDGCKHERVVLDQQSYSVKCCECEKHLDPFWYLKLLARELKLRARLEDDKDYRYRELEQERRNAQAKGKHYSRPEKGQGAEAWDLFTELSEGPPPTFIYRRRNEWYGSVYDGEYVVEYSLHYARRLIAEREREQAAT